MSKWLFYIPVIGFMLMMFVLHKADKDYKYSRILVENLSERFVNFQVMSIIAIGCFLGGWLSTILK